MKPLGQRPHKRNFIDHHMIKLKNWWEGEGCDENKKAEKIKSKKEIVNQLNEEYNEYS